jgi:hypothetical protein
MGRLREALGYATEAEAEDSDGKAAGGEDIER